MQKAKPGSGFIWEAAGRQLQIEMLRRKRKTLRLEVQGSDCILVTCPLRCTKAQVRQVLEQHVGKLVQMLERWQPPVEAPLLTEQEWAHWQAGVEQKMRQMMDICREETGLSPATVRIKELSSIWGSCSSRRNISLNIRLIYCPEAVMRYVMIHELCHLQVPNHGAAFWQLVERFVRDAKAHRAWLRTHGTDILRLPLGLALSGG